MPLFSPSSCEAVQRVPHTLSLFFRDIQVNKSLFFLLLLFFFFLILVDRKKKKKWNLKRKRRLVGKKKKEGTCFLAGLTRRLLVHVHLLAGLHGLRQEALRVLQALQRAAARLLRLLLFGDLGGLVLDLARTGEGAVDLTHDDGSPEDVLK